MFYIKHDNFLNKSLFMYVYIYKIVKNSKKNCCKENILFLNNDNVQSISRFLWILWWIKRFFIVVSK